MTPELKISTTHDVITHMGPFSRYQMYTCFVLQYSRILAAGVSALDSLGQLKPQFVCLDPDVGNSSSVWDECEMLSNCRNRTVVVRHFKSMVEEWDLTCDKEIFWYVTVIVGCLGHFIGSVIGGHICDYFGRKRALYLSQFAVCIISTLSTACTSWTSFSVCFFLIGLTWTICETSSFILAMEFTDARHRWIVNASFQSWIQYAIAALVAYLTADWRLYLIIINVIFAPLLVFYLIFSESPRFLIYQQHLHRAATVVTDISSERWNKTGFQVSEEELREVGNSRASDPQYPSVLDLFRSKARARVTLTLFFCTFIAGVLISFFTQNIRHHWVTNNPFINLAIFGLARTWVPVLIVALEWRKAQSIPRRPTCLCFMGAVTLFAVGCLALDLAHSGPVGPLQHCLGLLGASLSSSGVWMSITQVTVEFYPTAIRGIAFGCILAMISVGEIVAVFIQEIEHWIGVGPDSVVCILCLLSCIVAYLGFPETRNQPMQDGLSYCERRPKKDCWKIHTERLQMKDIKF